MPRIIEPLGADTLCFVAHPVSSDPQYNCIKALYELRKLMDDHLDHTFIAPWIDYCQVLNDHNPEHRARGMRDDLVVLRRCDELWLIGDEISNGMRGEWIFAEKHNIKIIDLVSWPKYVSMDGKTSLSRRPLGLEGVYYSDAGEWCIEAERRQGRLFSVSECPDRNGIELIKCDSESRR